MTNNSSPIFLTITQLIYKYLTKVAVTLSSNRFSLKEVQMFLGYNDGYMGLAWYEEDLEEEFDFDYYDAIKEVQNGLEDDER